MKNSNKQKYLVIMFFFLIGFFYLSFNNFVKLEFSEQKNISNTAALTEYQPLTSITGLTNTPSGQQSFEKYVTVLFNWGLSIAVILSIVMITLGGIEYMTVDSLFKKKEGLKKINGAIVGLLLALSTWLILKTIDPRIVGEKTQTKNNIFLSIK